MVARTHYADVLRSASLRRGTAGAVHGSRDSGVGRAKTLGTAVVGTRHSKTSLRFRIPHSAFRIPHFMYIELHCHSAFSFLDGASLPEQLALTASQPGYPALALTDHHGLYG